MGIFGGDYGPWRVQANGMWHRVRFYMFHYSEARNENRTHCGLVLNNPPFHDPGLWSLEAKPLPEPPCPACETEYVRWHLRNAESEVAMWRAQL